MCKSRWITIVVFVCSVLISCSDNSELQTNGQNAMFDSTVYFIPSIEQTTTRASTSDIIQEFYVSAYSGISNRGKNVRYYWTGSSWASDRTINWPSGSKTINFFAVSKPMAEGGGISNVKLSSKEQSFDYTVDNQNPEDLLLASTLNTTYSDMDGKVRLDFAYSLAYPYFTCKQGIEGVTVKIKEVIVHNLWNTGRVLFDLNRNSRFSWTVVDSLYANYRQVFDEPVTLDETGKKAVQISNKWIWMPQRPNKWTTSETDTVALVDADAQHQCYVELKCQIIQDGAYIWGAESGENQYESVYIPFGTNFRSIGYSRPVQLTFTGGFLKDGTVFKPHGGSEITISSWVQASVLIDPWEEMDSQDITF
jgi:hypothetical protein